ncbi:hypothetical protein D3C75_1242700 [compost metagenome]
MAASIRTVAISRSATRACSMGIVPYRRASTLIGKCLVANSDAKITRGFRGITNGYATG